MNTLMLELSRLDESDRKISTIPYSRFINFEDRFLLTSLWADYYFFVNTVERTYRLAMILYEMLGETEKAIQIKLSHTFDNVRKFRNGIEHLYEDAAKPGGEFYNQHRTMGPDREIFIGALSFKASESSLQVLYQIYDDISNIIEQKYVIPNKEIVDRLGLK
ncbi:MAG: hypothetical protein HDT15_04415 [Oscillibacter sp.]|nr:hypothetical protein [Oscillibacter sp.]